MKHVRTKGWHVLSSRLTKFPRMNPDARWQQRRIPQCPHGRNPDHRGNYSSWTCSLETAEYFSNKFDDVSMNMFPFRFLGTGGENEFFFLNCAMCKDSTCSWVVGCLEFSWCQGRFEKTAFATRLPFLGRPAPPPRTWALSPWIKKYKTLKNKTTALQAY